MTLGAVVVITYGHDAEMIRTAIAGATQLKELRPDLRIAVVDDSSSSPPRLPDYPIYATPVQMGYAGAVNWILEAVIPEEYERVIFVNPDAAIDSGALAALLDCPERLAVPSIVGSDGTLENVLPLCSPWREVGALAVGPAVMRMLQRQPSRSRDAILPLGRPWVPAGTVLAISTELLRETKLDTRMFWIEMSDLARRLTGEPFRVLSAQATHQGDSSKSHASRAVRMSQLAARRAYIQTYGSAPARVLAHLALLVFLARRLVARDLTRPIQSIWSVWYRHRDWRSA